MKTSSSNSKRKKALNRNILAGKTLALLSSPPSEKTLAQERVEYQTERFKYSMQGMSHVAKELVKNGGLPQSTNLYWSKKLRIEAAAKNLYAEIAGLVTAETSAFNAARLALFFAVGKIIEYGDVYPDSVKQEIRDAGEKLNQSGGFRDMSDILVWSFIPNPLHREIELIWDGIGDWRA